MVRVRTSLVRKERVAATSLESGGQQQQQQSDDPVKQCDDACCERQRLPRIGAMGRMGSVG